MSDKKIRLKEVVLDDTQKQQLIEALESRVDDAEEKHYDRLLVHARTVVYDQVKAEAKDHAFLMRDMFLKGALEYAGHLFMIRLKDKALRERWMDFMSELHAAAYSIEEKSRVEYEDKLSSTVEDRIQAKFCELKSNYPFDDGVREVEV